MRRAEFFFFILGAVFSCALIAGPAAAQTCIEPPAGLLGWWPGDGDSIDLQSGLHGVAVNGASYSPGLVGEAFDFNGVDDGRDDRVDLPASALDGLGDFTVEMWVQSEDDQGAWLSGATDRGVGIDNEALLFQGVNGFQAAVRSQSTGALPIFLNDGAWHHLAYMRSGAMGMLYVDGVAMDARSVPTEPLEIGPGGLMLGQEQDCLGGCFDPEQALDGRVDELAIYDRALSEAEIVAIVDAREAGKCKPPSKADLLQQIDEQDQLIDEQDQLIDEKDQLIDEKDQLIDEMDQAIADLETEVDTLLGRIDELEAASGETVPDPCKHGRGCKHCHVKKIHRMHSHHVR